MRSDIRDVHAAIRIHPDAVGIAAEIAGAIAVFAPSANQRSIEAHDVYALMARCDVQNAVGVKNRVVGAGNVRPLGDVVAVDIEHLTAIVLPIHNVDLVIGIDRNVVGQVELTGAASVASPRCDQLSL